MRSTFRSFLAFAALACLSAASFAHATIVAPICAVARAVKDWAFDGFKMAARTDGEGFARPQVPFVQARAFVSRLAKRERPVTFGAWRMCPSA